MRCRDRLNQKAAMHNENDHPHEPDFTPTYREERPYWKRAHLDWRLWVAVVFVFAALAIYIVTVDLSTVPAVRVNGSNR